MCQMIEPVRYTALRSTNCHGNRKGRPGDGLSHLCLAALDSAASENLLTQEIEVLHTDVALDHP